MNKPRGNAQEIGSFLKKARNAVIRKTAPVFATKFPKFSITKLKQPIFIIGCHRSGTTLLTRLLDMHKDIANWTEANEIWDPLWYPWTEANIDKPPIEYDPYAFTNRWWSENQSRIDEIKSSFGAFQFLHGKSHFMNKSPYNSFRLPYLKEHFPGAKFVYILRDGRAVVSSHVTKLLEEDHLHEWPTKEQELFKKNKVALAEYIAHYWRLTVEEVETQSEKLGLEQDGLIHTLTYTELCDNPMKVLNEICDFLDLDSNRFLHGVEHQKVHKSHKWQKELDKETLTRIVEVMEPKLSEYSLAD